MDQKMSATLADCYSEISDIWLNTALIARGKIANRIVGPMSDLEWWEALERRCCIRAGYYARLAEQHRESPSSAAIVYTEPRMRSLDEYAPAITPAELKAWKKQRKAAAKPGRAGGLARAKRLSPKRRSKIAKDAAIARWKEHPNAS
ncbi:hypothetical protein LCGC14_1916950 [marine sediment metagenome]|uniref:Uncharacterized protein n=1 Tax=marine sediment metagenome TaxID=412755 RepID=A0A0F9GF80_9ZZZZ